MKILYLNSIITVPNEKGSKKINRATTSGVKDNEGFPKSWYIEQNLRPPEGVEDDEELLLLFVLLSLISILLLLKLSCSRELTELEEALVIPLFPFNKS